MNTPQRKRILAVAAASLLSLSLGVTDHAFAQAATATTDPVGFTTLTVAAKPANNRGFSFISLDLLRPTSFRGLVPAPTVSNPEYGASTVGGVTVINFPAGTFTASQFTGTGNASYLELKNGTSSGLISDITTATTSSITLKDNITSLLVNGTTTFATRPHWTLGTVFGPTNSAGLKGAANPTDADNVQIVGANGLTTTFYYNTANGRWQNNFADATNTVLPRNSGLIVERKNDAQGNPGIEVKFNLVGEVKLGPTGLLIAGGSATTFTIAPNLYPLASVRLADIGLYTGNPNTGLAGDTAPSTADTIGIYNTATGLTTTYYYNSTNNRWQSNFADASNVTIPEGAAITVTRRNSRPAFVWYAPQPMMNLN